MNTRIISNEGNSCSLSSWKLLIFNNSLYSLNCNCKISWLYCWLRHIKNKDVSGRHRRSIHILIRSNKVNWSTVEFWSIIMILPFSSCGQRWIVILLSLIDISTKIANPFLSSINKPYEWIKICSTFFASHNWFTAIWNRRNFFSSWQITIWLNYNSYRKTNLLLKLKCVWDSLCSSSHKRLIRIELS